MKPFSVLIKEGPYQYYYHITLISNDESFEKYQAKRNGEIITLSSNRPMLRSKGLKHKRPDWKHDAHNKVYAGNIKQIIEGIMKVVD